MSGCRTLTRAALLPGDLLLFADQRLQQIEQLAVTPVSVAPRLLMQLLDIDLSGKRIGNDSNALQHRRNDTCDIRRTLHLTTSLRLPDCEGDKVERLLPLQLQKGLFVILPDEGVGILTVRQLQKLHIHPFGECNLHSARHRHPASIIRVVDHHDPAAIPLQNPDLTGRKCRPGRSDDIADAGSSQSDHIGVPLHQNHLFALAYLISCEVYPVHHLTLIVDRSLGRVDVLGFLSGCQSASGESDHLACRADYWKDKTATKGVIESVRAAARLDEICLVQILLPDPLFHRCLQQYLSSGRGIPQAKLPDGLPVVSTSLKVGSRLLRLIRLQKLPEEVESCKFESVVDPLLLLVCFTLFRC